MSTLLSFWESVRILEEDGSRSLSLILIWEVFCVSLRISQRLCGCTSVSILLLRAEHTRVGKTPVLFFGSAFANWVANMKECKGPHPPVFFLLFSPLRSLRIVDLFRVSQFYWARWTEHRDLDSRPGLAHRQLSDPECKLLEPQCPHGVKGEICELLAHGLNLGVSCGPLTALKVRRF